MKRNSIHLFIVILSGLLCQTRVLAMAGAATAAVEAHGADWTHVGTKDGQNILPSVESVKEVAQGLATLKEEVGRLEVRLGAIVRAAITQDNLPAALSETVKRDALDSALKDVVRLQHVSTHVRPVVVEILTGNGIAADSNVGGVLAEHTKQLGTLTPIVEGLNAAAQQAAGPQAVPDQQAQASQAFPLTMKQAACVAAIFVAGQIVWHGVPKLYNAWKNRSEAKKKSVR